MHRFFKRPDRLGARLRKERPQPRKELVERIVERTSAGQRSGPRLLPRLQLAGGVTAAGIVAVVALGGPGDLARTIGDLNEASHTPSHDQYTEQVTICHRPPGNPDNARTIRVGAPAAEAHFERHGDTAGACPSGGAAAGAGGSGGGGASAGGGSSGGGTVSGSSLRETGNGREPVGGATVFADHNGNGDLDRDDEGNPTEPFDESDTDGSWTVEGLQPGEPTIRGDDGNGMSCISPKPCVHKLTLGPGETESDLRFVYR